jgi:predicted dehydrogenase
VRNFAGLGALSAVCDGDTDTLRALGEQDLLCRTFVSYAEVLRDETILAVAIAMPVEGHANAV